MRLTILIPGKVFLDREAAKITAEAENGSFCLLPRHIDFVTSLVPGLLMFETPDGDEEFLAIDRGVLVKSGSDVQVAVTDAVRGPALGELKETVSQKYRTIDDRERKTREALARLEADFVRRFLEIRK